MAIVNKKVEVLIDFSNGTGLQYKESIKIAEQIPDLFAKALKKQMAMTLIVGNVSHTFNPQNINKISIEEGK
jgi:hypothetical protein